MEQLVRYVRAGKISKAHEALKIELDNRNLHGDGDLIIGARAVRDLLEDGKVVPIMRIETRSNGDVDITDAGDASVGITGRRVYLRIGGKRYSLPLGHVRRVAVGTKPVAILYRNEVYTPIIDADRVQAEAGARRIDEGLMKEF
ncbi:MAG TPA: hypothetical protein PLU40_07735 [Methanoculleus sp.]|nr:hypothetical protein [Methanoculleus sp.]